MPNLRQRFLAHVAQTSDFPLGLEIERAEGLYIYDRHGKKYLDLIAGIGVSALGHCHPAVVGAVQQQAQQYMHTLVYGEFILEPQVRLAEVLANLLPQPLDSVYFVNSGAEATEGAMKLAKRYTGRTEFIATRYAYHGSTQGAASLMDPTYFTQAYYPLLPGIKHIDFNCSWCLRQITSQTAAVIVETVQAEWGIRKPSPTYLQELRNRCDETGTLLILDEIQAGMGRTGSLFAFEQYGIIPDILLLAKGLGGGMPIGAFISSKAMMYALASQPILGHITTFGGHPVCCAAALATVETLIAEGYVRQVKKKADLFVSLLKHPAILGVRHAGLWMAIELESFEQVKQVIDYCLKKGLITDWFLFNSRALRIAPPLIIGEEEIRWACGVILEGLDRIG